MTQTACVMFSDKKRNGKYERTKARKAHGDAAIVLIIA